MVIQTELHRSSEAAVRSRVSGGQEEVSAQCDHAWKNKSDLESRGDSEEPPWRHNQMERGTEQLC